MVAALHLTSPLLKAPMKPLRFLLLGKHHPWHCMAASAACPACGALQPLPFLTGTFLRQIVYVGSGIQPRCF